MSTPHCPFCTNKPLATHRLTAVHRDKYPLNPGHLLIVPRRHVADLRELTDDEHHELFAVAREILTAPDDANRRDGWNLGVNVGPAAGQTVMHVHLHLIPRRVGDVEDPRGGIRWVIPERADYWTRRGNDTR